MTTGGAELCTGSAAALIAKLARGEVTAAEAVEAHIARIERVNAPLNAIVVKRYDAARAEAKAADDRRSRGEPLPRLHGLPVTIKECIDVRDTPSTFGLRRLAENIAHEDEVHVARLRRAGAIILGKTNAGQLLLMLETDNPVYGRTNNPWDLDRSSGGSSGGEAAIIASGGSALGLGTDLGGSCRVPAAFCGIVGFKSTKGRADDPGRYSVPPGERAITSQIGLLARHVEDVELGLHAILDRSGDIAPPAPLDDCRTIDLRSLRVGVYEDDGILTPSPAVRRAVREAAQILDSAGAEVVEWKPPDLMVALDLYFKLLTADRGRGIARLTRGEKVDARLRPLIFMAQRSARSLAAMRFALRLAGQRGLANVMRGLGHGETWRYWEQVERLMAFREEFLRALDGAGGGPLDAILCPATALPAFEHGACRDLALAGSYSMLANILGYPAGVTPVTRVRKEEETGRRSAIDVVERVAGATEKGSAGLPVAVQIITRPWREPGALALLSAIEASARSRNDFTPPQAIAAPEH
jgi:fatty acid amide hydrolase